VKGTKQYIKRIFEFFVPAAKIKTKVEEVNGKFLDTADFTISSLSLEHDTPSNGYAFKEKDKMRLDKEKLRKLKIWDPADLIRLSKGKDIKLNKKIIKVKSLTYKQKGKKISFIFDTKLCQNVKRLAKDSDLAIIESTYSKEQKDLAKEYKHMTTEQAAQVAKSQNVKKLFLTHLSQRYEHKEKKLLKEAKAIFPDTELAQDFMKITI
jgi:ribonuclease Z